MYDIIKKSFGEVIQMLIQFSVENFKNFKEKIVWDLSKKLLPNFTQLLHLKG